MPELPEVETLVSDLRPHITGRRLQRVDLRFPAIVRSPEPERFAELVEGRTVTALTRRGKYLLHHLAGPPAGADLLVVHLGMTGHLTCASPADDLAPHTHLVIHLDNGMEYRYRDPRRFGRVLAGSEAQLVASRAMPRLGPEPLDPEFRAADLYRRLHPRRAPLKALLLDQAVLAGVGNIYADESCHRARVRPDRPGSSLSRPAAARLHRALRESLTVAIANRGSSVNSYLDAWGNLGRQQEELLVYGRGGEPCFRCGRPLAVVRLAGRTTVFCPRCQR